MEFLATAIAQHGYILLLIAVLMEALGLPVPAALAILTAGASSVHGPMHPILSLATALGAILLGDGLLYFLGRFTGWWTLRLLCYVSLNPDSCILRAADAFYKRGKLVLLFAKFVPGINTMAAPLAGSMNMKLWQFVRFDLAGATIYTVVYWSVGYLFSDFLAAITRGYLQFGQYLAWSIGLLFAGYLAWRISYVIHERRQPVIGMAPLEIARDPEQFAIFDVRSHGYYDKGAKRIRGSSRLEPNAIAQGALEFPKDRRIVLYCTCLWDATARKVARELALRGHVAWVIVGGFAAWKKAGLPLEPVPADEMLQLPTFQ